VALQNAQYDEIMRDYNRRQLHNKHILDEHVEEAYQRIPRLSEIDNEITSLSMRKARSLFRSKGGLGSDRSNCCSVRGTHSPSKPLRLSGRLSADAL